MRLAVLALLALCSCAAEVLGDPIGKVVTLLEAMAHERESYQIYIHRRGCQSMSEKLESDQKADADMKENFAGHLASLISLERSRIPGASRTRRTRLQQ